jgi:hypothetical protein
MEKDPIMALVAFLHLSLLLELLALFFTLINLV